MKRLYREGTASCKLSESKHPRVTNTAGVTGVWYDTRRGRWTAEMTLRRKKIRLGRCKSKEDAIKACRAAEEEYFQPLIDQYAKPKGDESGSG